MHDLVVQGIVMSKIGKKPIELENVQVEVKGQDVHYKGKSHSGVYHLPENFTAHVENKRLFIKPKEKREIKSNMWGLHRALINNALLGAAKEFERLVEINGLGFKCQMSGNVLTFSLGYAHKVTVTLPKEVKLTIDKTGQKLSFASFDKEKLGHVCSIVRALRAPEPYKGTGIKYAEEIIRKKAGKAKVAAGG